MWIKKNPKRALHSQIVTMSKRDMSVGTDFDLDTGLQEQSYSQPKKKKPEYPYVPKGVPLQLPPCRICGGKASGIHYGVNSCEACKVFLTSTCVLVVVWKVNDRHWPVLVTIHKHWQWM